MNRRGNARFAAALITATGCGDKSSYVLVTLQSGAPLSLTALDVTVTNAGASATAQVEKAISLPPDWSFSFQFGSERSGDVTFDVHALSGAAQVARASGTVTLVPHSTVPLAIPLTPVMADMGMRDLPMPDAAMPDMTPPSDQALPVFPSCMGLAANCGPNGNESCCESLWVTGGTYYRSYDVAGDANSGSRNYTATVSDFRLDKYEVTVGRFRAFLNAGMGTQANPPAAGAGAHAKIANSGWDPSWNPLLERNKMDVYTGLKGFTTPVTIDLLVCGPSHAIWTDNPGGSENRPINCVTWYEAVAFCAWDGGFLPTEAEWNYAASGGDEQRAYPWSKPASSTTANDTYAVYCGGDCKLPQNVGAKSPTGDGRWGHTDLAGNVFEWTLDWTADPYSINPCNDCASLTPTNGRKVVRGGSFNRDATHMRTGYRGFDDFSEDRADEFGIRCARAR